MSRALATSRQPRRLSPPLQRRLDAYGLLASATGLTFLIGPQLAEGRVVYTPIHQVIKLGHRFPLDLNHDGITDFTIVHSRNSTGTSCTLSVWLSVLPAAGNGVAGFRSDALALKPGARIGPKFYFQPRGFMAGQFQSAGCDYSRGGRWFNIKHRYLGLSFEIEGKTHYGWARFNVKESYFLISATLTGYAYETRPRQFIVARPPVTSDEADFRREPSEPAPGIPRSGHPLGVLALGAMGQTRKNRPAPQTNVGGSR